MATNKRFLLGESVNLKAYATTLGDPADPTDISLTITRPDGSEDSYAYSAATVERDALGVYSVDVVLDETGRWLWRWAGTGDVTGAAAGEILVRE
jgi:uncharacterized protein YfaS (alpha-2-macroglobulin family)